MGGALVIMGKLSVWSINNYAELLWYNDGSFEIFFFINKDNTGQ